MRRFAAALMLAVVAAPAEGRDLQSTARSLLGGRQGTVLLAEAQTGRVLAAVHPELADTAVPPGSVFKLATALAAVDAGIMPPGKRLVCRGSHRPHGSDTRLACWKPGGHGGLTLEEGLAHSCNGLFYQVGERTGARAIAATARRLGLGLPPGRMSAPPRPEAACTFAVGEGPGIAVTPRQVAGLVAALATDGRLRSVGWMPGPHAGTPIAGPEALARLRRGMRGSVLFGSGRSAAVDGLEVAGKTGTSTYTDGSNRTYGWFAGYAPASAPRVVVVVLVYGGSGFADAGPIARKVLAAWAGRP